MYCRCGNRNGYTAAPCDPPQGQWDRNNDFWVCADCLKPAPMYFRKLTYMRAPSRATAILSAVGDGSGRTILRWATAVSGERIETMVFTSHPRKLEMAHDQGRNILLELWQRLDTYIDHIRNPDTLPEHSTNFYQPRASELALVLSGLMSPFYADDKAVLAESMTRWTARQEGTLHESPGLAEDIYDPAPSTRVATKRPEVGTATPQLLDEAKQRFIVVQLNAGAFPPAELAKMFGVSEQVIQHNYDTATANGIS